jgi:hypothetical protein
MNQRNVLPVSGLIAMSVLTAWLVTTIVQRTSHAQQGKSERPVVGPLTPGPSPDQPPFSSRLTGTARTGKPKNQDPLLAPRTAESPQVATMSFDTFESAPGNKIHVVASLGVRNFKPDISYVFRTRVIEMKTRTTTTRYHVDQQFTVPANVATRKKFDAELPVSQPGDYTVGMALYEVQPGHSLDELLDFEEKGKESIKGWEIKRKVTVR